MGEPEPTNTHDNIQLAIAAQDCLLSESNELGEQELNLYTGASILEYPTIDHEEYILSQIDPEQKYDKIKKAYEYTDMCGKYHMVAAILKKYNKKGETEYCLIGATGTNYKTSKELKVINFEQAMNSIDRKEWEHAIKLKHDKMIKYNVFKAVPKSQVPPGTRVIDFAWAMKKKPDGTYRVRLAARRFKQEEGTQYHKDDKSAPVISDMGIKIVMVLIILGNLYTRITDVEGAFLHGEWSKGTEKIYVKVPKGFEKLYPP